MKTTVIYHRSDFDGIFCREIANKFLGETATYHGMEYGDPLPDIEGVETLYIMDFSVPEFMNHPGLIWIDHHKSAIEKFGPKAGYQIDGVAACRLAWQWFAKDHTDVVVQFLGLPSKQDFIDRKVNESLAVQLAGEYDVWDKRNPDAELFQHGLRSQQINFGTLLSSEDSSDYIADLLFAGKAIQYFQTKQNESVIKDLGFTFQWEGLTFLACNAARYNSFLFTAGLKPEHDACFGFKWTGKDWSISLYHASGKEHIDISLIAVKHGGGGHKGACGFRTNKLPFPVMD